MFASVLGYQDVKLQYILNTYVSAVEVEGVLSQIQEGWITVIAYYSKPSSATTVLPAGGC